MPSVEGRLMDRSDQALLAAFLLAAGLGTWTRCLMHDDGAVILSSGWFGSLWDLYISQIATRAAAVLAMHGPAWLARAAFDLDAGAYLTIAHVLYFAVPLVLWLVLRAVERDRLFSRLYLALALAMIYFPTELIFGVGVWLIWLALVSDPARSTTGVVLATLLLGAVMAFTHPALALMGLFFVAAGLALPLFGQRLPTRSLVAVAVLSVALLAFYLAAARWLPPTNPTDGASQEANRFAYLSPVWMLRTLTAALAVPAARRAGRRRLRTMVCRGGHEPEDRHLDAPHRPLCDGAGARPCPACAGGVAEARRAAPDPVRRHRCRQCLVLQHRSLAIRPLHRSRAQARHRRCRHATGAVAFQATGACGGPHSFQVRCGRGIRPGWRDAELRLVAHTACLLHLLSLRSARHAVPSFGRRRRVAALRVPGRRARPRSCPGRPGPAIPGISRPALLRRPAFVLSAQRTLTARSPYSLISAIRAIGPGDEPQEGTHKRSDRAHWPQCI